MNRKKRNTLITAVVIALVICGGLIYALGRHGADAGSGAGGINGAGGVSGADGINLESSIAPLPTVSQAAIAEYTTPQETEDCETVRETFSEAQTQEILYRFRRKEYLTEHFEKHGAEFGYKNEQEYLMGANSVIFDKASLHKLEAEDGDDVYFQESTGGLVIVSTDGYIRTYFKPSDGIDYFNRQ